MICINIAGFRTRRDKILHRYSEYPGLATGKSSLCVYLSHGQSGWVIEKN
jgi:hypothetical protein